MDAPCLVISLALILFLASLIPLKRLIARRLIRYLENRAFDPAWIAANERGRKPEQKPDRLFKMATISVFIAATGVFALSFVVKPSASHETANAAVQILLYGGLALAAVLSAIAFYLHYSGRGSRHVKYDVALTAIVWMSALTHAAFTLGRQTLQFMESTAAPAEFRIEAMRLTVGGLAFIALQVGLRFATRRVRTHEAAVAAFYDLQTPGVWLLLTVAYALIRYHLLSAVMDRPIVYLRSFGERGAPEVFAKIVLKATRRFGVVEGLMHRRQRASDLQSATDPIAQARFATSTDEHWQSWVSEKLRRASAVIIDITGGSDNLAWEVDAAMTIAGASRIAILVSEGTTSTIPSGVWHCPYSLAGRRPQEARILLENWLKGTLLARPQPAECRGASPAIDA